MTGSVGLTLCDEDDVFILKCFTNNSVGLRRDNDYGRPSLTEPCANVPDDVDDCWFVVNKCNGFQDGKTSLRCACSFSSGHDYGPDLLRVGQESRCVNQTGCMTRDARSDG